MQAKFPIALIVTSSLSYMSFMVRPTSAGNVIGQPMGSVPTVMPGFYGTPNGYGNPYASPYANPYANPYASPYVNPYANPYTNPYANPYTPYHSYGNGAGYYGRPVFYGTPQPVGGNVYSFNVAGAPLNFWRGPSGYYYPWMGGYSYSQYPIFVYNSGGGGATQALPPLSTIFSDLNEYLDKAKKDGKIDESEYEHLKRRAADLLSKENSIAYEEGGSIDPEQSSGIRRDVEALSAEVARSVRP